MYNPINIYYEFLSERTINALEKKGIKTVHDLISLSDDDIFKIRGVGQKGYQEINALLANINLDSDLGEPYADIPENQPAIPDNGPNSLHGWINTILNERTASILVDNFGLLNGQPKKSIEIANELNITRSRLGQILQKAKDKIKPAILHGKIDPSILQKLEEYAEKNTKLDKIEGLSNVYNNSAIAELYAKITEQFTVYKDSRLRSKWLVKDEATIKNWVDTAIEWLNSQISYVPIEKLVKESGIRKDIFLDLNSAKTEDGYIALVNGYRKDGINRINLILETMRSAVKPMTMQEISQKTGLSLEILRGYIYRIPGVVNVGNSIYALEEYGYTNKDSEELAIDYLREWGTPRHMNDIVKHVLHYRKINPSSISTMIYAKPEIFTRFSNGYVALAEWGYVSDARKKVVFEVSAREAVLTILKENDRPMSNRDILEAIIAKYGKKATNAMVTVSAATTELEREGIIERLGTRTYYYKLVS